MKKFLVLGDKGFIGSTLKNYLHDNSSDSIICCGSQYSVDITSNSSVSSCIKAVNPDVVINLAGITNINLSKKLIYSVNTLGVQNILECLKEIEFSGRFVTMSSSYVYAQNEDGVYSEGDIADGSINFYGKTKILAEKICKSFSECSQVKFNISILRIFNTIGPGQRPEFLLPKILSHFKNNLKEIELGDTDISRDYIDVRDLCQMILLVSSSGNSESNNFQIFNASNDEAVSIKSILRACAKMLNKKLIVQENSSFKRKSDLLTVCGSNSRIKSIGYKRKYNIEATLKKIYDNINIT